MGRKRKEKTEVLNIRVPISLSAKYRELSQAGCRSLTEQLCMALREWVDEDVMYVLERLRIRKKR
jgi:hypothetical protein